ncbi:carboxypeptidase-like regulatory domain-containing protein [Mucilaginibacter sp. CAU 1740]|uniref:carboxypeptidase-like regulatory domain-containing protein n=1 Tax=Mucilaginibacter sp. CAU 1740 TaxID=3140365 RepID=UPI00325A5A5A
MQIQKYLSGKLDAHAMHKLEMEALDDPFLMDALEGYENSTANHTLNLADLSRSLQQRTEEKRGLIIPWRVWPIAASVLIALTIGGLYLKRSGNAELQPNKNQVANNITPPVPVAADTIKTADTTNAKVAVNQTPKFLVPARKAKVAKPSANSVYQQEISAGDNKVANNLVPSANSGFNADPPAVSQYKADDQYDKKSNVSLDERIVFGALSSPVKKDSTAHNLLGLTAKTTPKQAPPSVLKLQGKVDGVTSSPAPGYSSAKAVAESLYIAGTIISRDDGSPIIGAAIRIKGTNRSTVTDVNGRFSLSSPVDNATLDVAYIGYQRRQISATRGDSVKIALAQDNSSLSEVVVTSRKKDDDAEEPSVEAAHPQLGWGSLKKYLQTNAVLSDGTTGTVTVTFTVFPSGVTDDFAVKKGLNDAANQKAIDLLKNGPSWVGSTNHKPEQVTVKVKFQKPKQ